MSSDSPIRKSMGDYGNRPRRRQLSTHLPLGHLILAVSKRVLSFLECSCSIRAGAVDTGNSVGSGDVSKEGSRAGVMSGGWS